MLLLKEKYVLIRSIVFMSMVFLNTTCIATSTLSGNIVVEIGSYFSPDKSFQAEITIANLGGFHILEIIKDGKVIHRIDDINAMVWIDDNKVLYSVSPIYGNPGIFIFDCKEITESVLVSPVNLTFAYPNGTDYFELVEYSHLTKAFFYYYASDVNSVDFSTFRKSENKRKQILK
jgi:hypothetical protein